MVGPKVFMTSNITIFFLHFNLNLNFDLGMIIGTFFFFILGKVL